MEWGQRRKKGMEIEIKEDKKGQNVISQLHFIGAMKNSMKNMVLGPQRLRYLENRICTKPDYRN